MTIRFTASVLLASAVFVQSATETYKPHPISRYEKLLSKPPFGLASAPAPAETPSPGFAANLYISGIAKIDGCNVVTVRSKDQSHSFILLSDKPGLDGIILVDVQWADQTGKSKATIRKGAELAVIEFDQAALHKNPAMLLSESRQAQLTASRNSRLREMGSDGRASLRTVTAEDLSPIVGVNVMVASSDDEPIGGFPNGQPQNYLSNKGSDAVTSANMQQAAQAAASNSPTREDANTAPEESGVDSATEKGGRQSMVNSATGQNTDTNYLPPGFVVPAGYYALDNGLSPGMGEAVLLLPITRK